MSVIRPTLPEDPVEYDLAPLLDSLAPSTSALAPLLDSLEHARADSREDPLADRPDRLLADYNGTRGSAAPAGRTRASSELYAILQAARRIRDTVDRVIMLGDAGTTQGVRTVFASCCHPFHNELSRGERGGRPRLSFTGHHADGDVLQGLIDLVAPAGASRTDDLLQQWGVVLCDGHDSPSAPATAIFLRLLLDCVGGDRARLAERVVPVGRRTGDVADLAAEIGCPHVFTTPDGAAGVRGVFAPAGLLPAAIVGIDVVRLLRGAAAMNRRYREAAAGQNPVLQFVAGSRLATRRLGAAPRLVTVDTDRLGEVVRWQEHLVAGAQGPMHVPPPDAAPVIRLLAGEPRRDPLAAVPLALSSAAAHGGDGILDRMVRLRREPQPGGSTEATDTAVIRLPRIDEHSIGQLLQMLLLAAVVEERLAG